MTKTVLREMDRYIGQYQNNMWNKRKHTYISCMEKVNWTDEQPVFTPILLIDETAIEAIDVIDRMVAYRIVNSPPLDIHEWK